MTPTPFRPGDVIAGKYRVERVLGQGGMGVVLAATQLELKRHVALKFILPGALSRPQAEGRFLREARAAAGLTSEHSVRIFDFGRLEDGAAYLVMEYLEGTDLAALLESKGPLPVALAVEYVLQAAVGLAEAHARGIVHRDIKPQNLFLTASASGEALVKVLDFGVSKVSAVFSGFDATKSGAMLGSPGYMAPEQMRSANDVDARADIWALGCTLYVLLTGHDAFDAGSLAELCAQVLHGEPRPITELRALPAGLAACVQRCLAKEPAQRPSDLAALALELVPFAKDKGPALLAKVQGALSGARAGSGAPRAPHVPAADSSMQTRGARRFLFPAGIVALAAAAALAWRVLPGSAPRPLVSETRVVPLPPSPPTTAAAQAMATPPPSSAHEVDASVSVGAPSAEESAASPSATSHARRARVRAEVASSALAAPSAPAAQSAETAPSAVAPVVVEPRADDARDPRLMRH